MLFCCFVVLLFCCFVNMLIWISDGAKMKEKNRQHCTLTTLSDEMA